MNFTRASLRCAGLYDLPHLAHLSLFEGKFTRGPIVFTRAFGREIGEAHDQLAAARQLDGFDQAVDLTASRLTLLGDDDLELDIRVREVAVHLREVGGRDL